MSDADELSRHLSATAELPVKPSASPWLGEAAAVAEDLSSADLPPEVERERAAHVVDLLEQVEGTGNEEADARVERALELARQLAD